MFDTLFFFSKENKRNFFFFLRIFSFCFKYHH